MGTTRTVEIAVGLFTAAGILALFFLAMEVANLAEYGKSDGYRVTARFDNVGGLKIRSPVTMAGVRVGRVTNIEFDDDTYEAVVQMTIASKYDKLPRDTAASILTAGLLGEQYVGLEPGGADEVLRDGDEIKLTQSALILERLVGQFLFNVAKDNE